MHLNDYQKQAHKTAVYPKEYSIAYPILGLLGECGELANILKKRLRGDNQPDYRLMLETELGDILWYMAETATVHNIDLDSVARFNLKKLEGRKQTGTLKGGKRDENKDKGNVHPRK